MRSRAHAKAQSRKGHAFPWRVGVRSSVHPDVRCSSLHWGKGSRKGAKVRTCISAADLVSRGELDRFQNMAKHVGPRRVFRPASRTCTTSTATTDENGHPRTFDLVFIRRQVAGEMRTPPSQIAPHGSEECTVKASRGIRSPGRFGEPG